MGSLSRLGKIRELKTRERRLVWLIRALLVTGALATFGLPVLLCKTLGCSWGAALLWFIVMATLGLISMRYTPIWRETARRAGALVLYDQALGENRPGILLTRSFQSSLTVEPEETMRVFGSESPLHASGDPSGPKSFLLPIADACRKHGPVLAIGVARRGIEAEPRPELLFLEPEEDQWFELFKELSKDSRRIIMIPGETECVLQELDSIVCRQLCDRLLVFMPPTKRSLPMPLLRSNAELLRKGWSDARPKFGEYGISLPDYDPEGRLLGIDAQGGISKSISLRGSVGRKLQAAIDELLRQPAAGERPLSETMLRLEKFELPKALHLRSLIDE